MRRVTNHGIWIGQKPRSRYLAGHKIARARLMDGESVTLSAYPAKSRYVGPTVFYMPCGQPPAKCYSKVVLYRVKVRLKCSSIPKQA